jgi:hypothetical protein
MAYLLWWLGGASIRGGRYGAGYNPATSGVGNSRDFRLVGGRIRVRFGLDFTCATAAILQRAVR